MHILTSTAAADALAMGLGSAGFTWRGHAERFDTALAAWRQALTQGHYALPFFLVLDLTGLVCEGLGVRFASEAREAPACQARLRYEREILSRLLQTPCVMEAVDLVKPGAGTAAMRQHAIGLLLDRLAPHWPRHSGVNPGSLRTLTSADISSADPAAAADRFARGHPDIPPLTDSLEAFVNAAAGSVQWSRLLESEDFFELAHLTHLGTAHLRLGCRQIIRLSRQLGAARLPEYDLRQHDADSETAFIDETTYPTGGFSGLTNQGSFENLLTSELAYMDDTPAGVSLFDLRFVEGELLFYLRDDGTMRRRRRTVHFVIDLGDLFSWQSPGGSYQYSILAQALCLRLKEDLSALFELDALRFHFHLLPPEPPDILEAESGMLRVLLADDMAHDRVRLGFPARLPAADLTDPQRKSYAVILTHPARAAAWQQDTAPICEEGLLHCRILIMGENATTRDPAGLAAVRAGLAGELIGAEEAPT